MRQAMGLVPHDFEHEIIPQKITFDDFVSKYAYTSDDFDVVIDKYLIKDFMEERAINLIYAGAKTGKSYFIQSLIKHLLPLRKDKKFIYLDNDNSAMTAKRRKLDLISKEDNFFYIGKRAIIDSGGGKNFVNNVLLNISVEYFNDIVIVIDSFRNFQNDFNQDKDIIEIMEKLEKLREFGATIIILHHTKKSDEKTFRGGNGIIESCDNVFFLTNLAKGRAIHKTDEFHFVLELTRTRNLEDSKKGFYINNKNDEFKELEPSELYNLILPQICVKAYEILKESGELNQSMLCSALGISGNYLRTKELEQGNELLYKIFSKQGKNEKIYVPI